MSNEVLSRVTQGFNSANTPRDVYNTNELLSRVTHVVDSANTP